MGFSSKKKSIECIPSDIGKYASKMGQPHCHLCPNGSASSDAGAESCSNCTIGSYSDVAGATECTFCSNDQYTETDAAVSCSSCSAAGLSFALSQPEQCSTANAVIFGSIVGGVVVIILVAVILVFVLVRPSGKSHEVLESPAPSNETSRYEGGIPRAQQDSAYLKEDSTDLGALPQPPRPDSTRMPKPKAKEQKPVQIKPVNNKKKRYSSAGVRKL